MGFSMTCYEDINTIEKFYSFLMGAKNSEETFFDSFFVPAEVDYAKFFQYLVSKNILHESIYNSILKNINESLSEEVEELEDEDYYLISLGVKSKHIRENDSESSYLLCGSDEAIDDINAYWYLLLEYIFTNKGSDDDLNDAFESLLCDARDFYDNDRKIRCEYYKIPTKFDFLGVVYNTEKISELDNILTDCLEMCEDEMLKDLLQNALDLVK